MITDCFSSIDWGTTNPRIRVVAIPYLHVTELIESAKGVKELHSDWMLKGGGRQEFYGYIIFTNVSNKRT